MLVDEEYVTVPVTAPLGPETVKVDEPMDDAFMASLNVAVSAVFTGTAVVPFAGVTAVTVGTGAWAVVNDQE